MLDDMRNKDTLTQKQQRVYAFIKQRLSKGQSAPTLAEIAKEISVKSLRSVTQYLEALEQKQLIERSHYATRGIRLASPKNADNELIQVPVFASAGCGSPSVIAQRTFDEYISVTSDLIKNKKNVFVIKATGQSMRDAGISDGDFVLVEQTEAVENGDLIVAIIDDNAVIKKLSAANNAVILYPVTNDPKYRPIILRQNFLVFGKVIEILKVEQDDDYKIIPV
jgi:repressor LexA